MIKLYGFSYSNYYNIVKHVLLHKGLPFEEVQQFGADDAYLEISPLGKVPAMTTEHGECMSESTVCCDYLEDAYPFNSPLYPADDYDRARVRQVIKVSELYLELAGRRLIPFSISKSPVPDALAQEVSDALTKGIAALNSLAEFDPYVMGNKLTMADIYLRYVLGVVALAGALLERDFVAEIEGIEAWQEMMADTDIARKVDADRDANGPAFFAYVKERYGM
ncbi:glutathione S-transferase family protein [Congregibacter sp.]|uniref:glutathione S-transferase family protein n=1 Tax=Congregibacter sp. TaxID=2744308 RepID=UPI003F6B28FA